MISIHKQKKTLINRQKSISSYPVFKAIPSCKTERKNTILSEKKIISEKRMKVKTNIKTKTKTKISNHLRNGKKLKISEYDQKKQKKQKKNQQEYQSSEENEILKKKAKSLVQSENKIKQKEDCNSKDPKRDIKKGNLKCRIIKCSKIPFALEKTEKNKASIYFKELCFETKDISGIQMKQESDLSEGHQVDMIEL